MTATPNFRLNPVAEAGVPSVQDLGISIPELDGTGCLNSCATGLRKRCNMAGGLLKILGQLLLPERYGNDQTVPQEPLETLVSVYNQLLQLAAQIESHADGAPYPHVAKRLRSIAAEKRESAQQLKSSIESRRAWISEPVRLAATGKNHWERVGRDLADQKSFENFLARLEPHLSTEYPELAEILFKLRTAQVAHRETLAEIIALADPQATQT